MIWVGVGWSGAGRGRVECIGSISPSKRIDITPPILISTKRIAVVSSNCIQLSVVKSNPM